MSAKMIAFIGVGSAALVAVSVFAISRPPNSKGQIPMVGEVSRCIPIDVGSGVYSINCGDDPALVLSMFLANRPKIEIVTMMSVGEYHNHLIIVTRPKK